MAEVFDTSNQTIRHVTPAGIVVTAAGLAGYAGSIDGTGSAARFSGPGGVAVDAGGNVYVADSNNFSIRTSASGFARGDVDGDGTVGTADLIYLINTLFANGPAPVGSGDADGDGNVDINDVFYLVNYLFAGGAAP